MPTSDPRAGRYRAAGVDLGAAESAKAQIVELVKGTRTAASLGNVGAFGGLVRLPQDVRDPVLVASTDGVGTKVLVAIRTGRHDTVGEDLVNHCVNDILVHGARPIGFLDYYATGRLDPSIAAAVVAGVARGCRAHGMTLVGGETAEMPDV
ncbi:MAG: AIR synthase related protein, partial [Gemmatimonadales bacterium]